MKFHLDYEVKHPEMSDVEDRNGRPTVSRNTYNTLRGYRRFPSLQDDLHHDIKRISAGDFESLVNKYPHLKVEGTARVAALGDYMGAILSIAGWNGDLKLGEWEQEFHPIVAKIETESGVSFFAGFQVDCD